MLIEIGITNAYLCVMLPNTIPLSGIPTTMPGVTSEAAFKGDGLPVSLPFKDLLLELQTAGEVTPPLPNIVDTAATVVTGSGKSTDLSSLVVSDDSVVLPVLQPAPNALDKSAVQQVSSNSTENSAAAPPGSELQPDGPAVPQSGDDEPQVILVPPMPKGSVTGKPDRKTDAEVPIKSKLPSKRTAASETIPPVSTEVTVVNVSSAAIDSNTQAPPAPAVSLVNSPVAGGAATSSQKIAPSSSVKWPVAMAQVASQKNEPTDQVDKVVASVLSSADDQSSSHDAIAIESNTKAGRTTSLREPSFVVSSPQPAAIFHASLLRETRSNGSFIVSDDEPTLTAAETLTPSTVSAPVSHLDLQWKDGMLGDISVRAEMREGVLHAVVNGSHVSSSVSPAELHQFLEESRIPVHSLQINGVEGVKHISEVGGFDANTSAGTGAQTSLSYRDESSGSSARNHDPHNRVDEEDEEKPIAVLSAPMTQAVQTELSHLSIHI
ncbi:hypothetical protein [Terriglobus sp. RCC_193]|uniref:hypothetical protein n=1 Tax=Terriglobus sp. RCC_193 TaxID=3239218 RepID=UPI003523DB2A